MHSRLFVSLSHRAQHPDYPALFDPPATTMTLEQNYRSTQPILKACNAVSRTTERFPNTVLDRTDGPSRCSSRWSTRRRRLVVVDRVLTNREAGMELRDQAVLMRASHHSGQLDRACQAQHSLRQVWRAEIPGGSAHQGCARHPAGQKTHGIKWRVCGARCSRYRLRGRAARGLLDGGKQGFSALAGFSRRLQRRTGALVCQR
jgi:hypothetical protein